MSMFDLERLIHDYRTRNQKLKEKVEGTLSDLRGGQSSERELAMTCLARWILDAGRDFGDEIVQPYYREMRRKLEEIKRLEISSYEWRKKGLKTLPADRKDKIKKLANEIYMIWKSFNKDHPNIIEESLASYIRVVLKKCKVNIS